MGPAKTIMASDARFCGARNTTRSIAATDHNNAHRVEVVVRVIRHQSWIGDALQNCVRQRTRLACARSICY
eukprot:CAMPEP_0169172622 /NCGR_PEP_ID=MMETSP1015-20121227/63466_1 /TAXON_ID=342587 /ORGANISM="Karlodinium micrum, Strain CCMP2283" /LENGTH=70 /DNA_ID=CAMNT_0009246137 /DNA_START=64 /DNA_END=273 /DNA_ORIENTATION=+